MPKRPLLHWMALVVLLTASACGAGEARDLIFGEWMFTHLRENPIPPFETERAPRIAFGEEGFSGLGSLSGFGGCNQFGGEFVRRADRLSFRELYATRVHCPGLSEFEDDLIGGLELVTRYELDGGTLILHTEYVEFARLERVRP
jgi:heat shock protein HslJ